MNKITTNNFIENTLYSQHNNYLASDFLLCLENTLLLIINYYVINHQVI